MLYQQLLHHLFKCTSIKLWARVQVPPPRLICSVTINLHSFNQNQDFRLIRNWCTAKGFVTGIKLIGPKTSICNDRKTRVKMQYIIARTQVETLLINNQPPRRKQGWFNFLPYPHSLTQTETLLVDSWEKKKTWINLAVVDFLFLNEAF